MTEFIYALSNPAMPGLLKLGRSARSVEDRATELSSSSGVPLPFRIEHVVPVSDSEYAERDVHQVLCKYRLSVDREFFRCRLDEAIVAMDIAKRVDERRFAEAQQFAKWLMARMDLNKIPQVISWLEGCKAKEVIAALRREAA